jgi:hypothetical protein
MQGTIILARRCMDWTIRERTEIKLHLSNMNRGDGFSRIKSWKPLIHDLKE